MFSIATRLCKRCEIVTVKTFLQRTCPFVLSCNLIRVRTGFAAGGTRRQPSDVHTADFAEAWVNFGRGKAESKIWISNRRSFAHVEHSTTPAVQLLTTPLVSQYVAACIVCREYHLKPRSAHQPNQSAVADTTTSRRMRLRSFPSPQRPFLFSSAICTLPASA